MSMSAYFPSPFNNKYSGFTLVELMIVVVILALFAGMMIVSVSTNDSRKNMAFYEHLQSNLAYIRLLSMEQMQPYGLAIKLTKDDGSNNSELVVVKLANAYRHQQSQNPPNMTLQNSTADPQATTPNWQLDNQIEPLPIPANVQIDIQPMTANNGVLVPLPWFDPSQAPPIMWFGTGETTPVKITLQNVNTSTQTRYQVGNTILLNAAGVVELVP